MDNIYEALKTIKEVCINNPSCVDCPLRTKSEGCYMKYKTPSTWLYNNQRTDISRRSNQ